MICYIIIVPCTKFRKMWSRNKVFIPSLPKQPDLSPDPHVCAAVPGR